MLQIKKDTFLKQVPIAIAAIGQHMHEHQLPVPLSIDIYPDREVISVRIIGSGVNAHRAWLDSLLVEDEQNESVAGFSDQLRTAWLVRLPDMGIRFELVAYRARPFLAAVSA